MNSSYRPSLNDPKKYRILKNLRNNKDIIVLKPDKRNGVVLMERKVYENCCLEIINDKTKFKRKFKENSTLKNKLGLNEMIIIL